MKKLLNHLANLFRKSAAAAPVGKTAPDDSPGPELRTHLASLPTIIAPPSIPPRPNSVPTTRATPQPNETRMPNSINADYITRQELRRELELLRRIIESRK